MVKSPSRPSLRTDAGRVLADDPAWTLRALARAASRRLDAATGETGLGSAQFALLCLIASARDDRLADLAARAGVDPSTLSRTLAPLERDGWIEIAVVETDRRRRAVWLTETGATRLASALPAYRREAVALSTALSDAAPDWTALVEAVDRRPKSTTNDK